MDFHSAWNIPRQAAEIEWMISQKDKDDICHPLCLLFIICEYLNSARERGPGYEDGVLAVPAYEHVSDPVPMSHCPSKGTL